MSIGGLVSVALSVASQRLGITQLPAQWSPDFPLRYSQRSPSILSVSILHAHASSNSGMSFLTFIFFISDFITSFF